MNVKPLAAVIAAGLLMAGCGQRQDNSAATAPAQPPVQASAVADSKDPSLPPADAALATPKSADDAKQTALTERERDSQMPMKGQANDHSTPDRAKEGKKTDAPAKEGNS